MRDGLKKKHRLCVYILIFLVALVIGNYWYAIGNVPDYEKSSMKIAVRAKVVSVHENYIQWLSKFM